MRVIDCNNKPVCLSRLQTFKIVVAGLVFFVITPKLAAQKNNLITKIGKIVNGYDSLYIGKAKEDYVISLKNTAWFDSYSIFENETELFLQSDLKYNLGASFGFKSIVLGYTINLDDLFSSEKGLSRQFNFNIFTNRLSIETNLFKNEGQTNLIKYKNSDESLQLEQSFNGLIFSSASTNVLYYWNYKRYSNSASYSNGHNFIQLKNAGSLLLSLTYSKQEMWIDIQELKNRNLQLDLDELSVTNKIYYMGVGYGYNYLANKNLLLNLTFVPSLGFRYGYDNNKRIEGKLSFNNNAKLALSYTINKYVLGCTVQHSGTIGFTDTYTYNNSLMNINVFACLRF